MADVPFPLNTDDPESFKSQIWELFRQIYEEKIGGADLGDVFGITNDVMTLVLATASGLTKSGSELAISPTSTGGIQVTADGVLIKLVATGGLETGASGLAITLNGTSLTKGASGLSVTLPINRSGVATLVAGTVAVNDAATTANSRIILTAQDNNSTGTLRISARVAGVSFTITSSNAGDTGVVAYAIIEP